MVNTDMNQQPQLGFKCANAPRTAPFADVAMISLVVTGQTHQRTISSVAVSTGEPWRVLGIVLGFCLVAVKGTDAVETAPALLSLQSALKKQEKPVMVPSQHSIFHSNIRLYSFITHDICSIRSVLVLGRQILVGRFHLYGRHGRRTFSQLPGHHKLTLCDATVDVGTTLLIFKPLSRLLFLLSHLLFLRLQVRVSQIRLFVSRFYLHAWYVSLLDLSPGGPPEFALRPSNGLLQLQTIASSVVGVTAAAAAAGRRSLPPLRRTGLLVVILPGLGAQKWRD